MSHDNDDEVGTEQRFIREHEGDPPPAVALRVRTFSVRVNGLVPLLVMAHSFYIKRDTAYFCNNVFEMCADPDCREWHFTQRCVRALRPFMDVQEVFDVAGSDRVQ